VSLFARTRPKIFTAIIVVLIVELLTPLLASAGTARKRSKSDRDVNAIGIAELTALAQTGIRSVRKNN
jgi:hypothetical protein